MLFPQTDDTRSHDLLTLIDVTKFVLFDLAMNVTTITINISYRMNITKFITKCHKYGDLSTITCSLVLVRY